MELALRKWQNTDAESIAKYADNKRVADNLRNTFPNPYTLEDAKRFISLCMSADEEKEIRRAITIDGEAVGSVCITLKDDIYSKIAEIGYWLGEPFWNNDIMSRAIRQLCDYAFAHCDIVRIYAEPFDYNIGSRRALEKAGFELEGILHNSVYKNGKIMNSCIYALLSEKCPKWD